MNASKTMDVNIDELFLSDNDHLLDIFEPAVVYAVLGGEDDPEMEETDLFDSLEFPEPMGLPMADPAQSTLFADPLVSAAAEVSDEDASTSGGSESLEVRPQTPEVSIEKKKQQEKGIATSSDKKDDDIPRKPKRSLSAYNLFFKSSREKLLEDLPCKGKKPRRSHGKMGFADMARNVAAKWKKISPEDRVEFDRLAALDTERYESAMTIWREQTKNHPELHKKNRKKKALSAATTKENKKRKKNPTKTTSKAQQPQSKTAPMQVNSLDFNSFIPALIASNGAPMQMESLIRL